MRRMQAGGSLTFFEQTVMVSLLWIAFKIGIPDILSSEREISLAIQASLKSHLQHMFPVSVQFAHLFSPCLL